MDASNVGKYGEVRIGEEVVTPVRRVEEQVESVNIGQETTARYGIEVPVPVPVMICGQVLDLPPPVNPVGFEVQLLGEPRLMPVYRRLMELRKVYGPDAEGYYRDDDVRPDAVVEPSHD